MTMVLLITISRFFSALLRGTFVFFWNTEPMFATSLNSTSKLPIKERSRTYCRRNASKEIEYPMQVVLDNALSIARRDGVLLFPF